jgi:hypothetical protein
MVALSHAPRAVSRASGHTGRDPAGAAPAPAERRRRPRLAAIKGGNIEDWAAKKTPDDLKVVSSEGSHSKELEHLFESKAQLETVETASVVGENTIVTIVFKRCRRKCWRIPFGCVRRPASAAEHTNSDSRH